MLFMLECVKMKKSKYAKNIKNIKVSMRLLKMFIEKRNI